MSRLPTHEERIAHNDYLAGSAGITTSTDHFLAGVDYARLLFADVFAAAHASLTARDLADQIAADERLARALAAYEPTDTDHKREAVDGLCVEENNDDDR